MTRRHRPADYTEAEGDLYSFGTDSLDVRSGNFKLIEIGYKGDASQGYLLWDEIDTGEIYSIDGWDIGCRAIAELLRDIGYDTEKVFAYFLEDEIMVVNARDGSPLCILRATKDIN